VGNFKTAAKTNQTKGQTRTPTVSNGFKRFVSNADPRTPTVLHSLDIFLLFNFPAVEFLQELSEKFLPPMRAFVQNLEEKRGRR
jgi:hypothetical protein